jgi:CHASE2 domain-containing sensor protein
MDCNDERRGKEVTVKELVKMPSYWIKSIFATIFIFVFMMFAGEFLSIFDFLDPVGEALEGYEITDQVFSNPTWREVPPAEEDIVIVNIGMLSRREIAQQINIINSYEPKVIGLDAIFRTLKPDTLGDMMLAGALANTPNVVMYEKLIEPDDEGIWQDNVLCNPIFGQDHPTASVNLIIESAGAQQFNFKTCRSFFPKEYLKNHETNEVDTVLAFGVALANYLKPENVEALFARGNDEELINYKGNVIDFGRTRLGTRFFALDVYDVLDTLFSPDLLKDKIVLMGFLGASFGDTRSFEDKYFTPLNAIQAGRANPDMFGVVVHANIISMILQNDYIDDMSENAGDILAFLICFLNVLLFTIIYYKWAKWYDGVTKLIQLMQAMVFVFTIILFFHLYNFKLNLTVTIIAVLLAGDVLEVFYGFVMNGYCWILNKLKKN